MLRYICCLLYTEKINLSRQQKTDKRPIGLSVLIIFYAPSPLPLKEIRFFITSPAIIIPTTGGTNDVLPGIWRRFEQLLFVPGGQTQFPLQVFSGPSSGVNGISLEYTTVKCFIFLFLSSFRITFASGQTEVFEISATSKAVGSVLLPLLRFQ